eukprot:TRINITY_DN20535_c0_g1_i1.p1 TRINITY_DN20535_c0_g1~~TRINITY_DN20535_c0_g1_i1.p1  ORF type:complete len:1171 (+),score=113.28 TRINITY_DN20535_c0_g1_i1:449-3514(+)
MLLHMFVARYNSTGIAVAFRSSGWWIGCDLLSVAAFPLAFAYDELSLLSFRIGRGLLRLMWPSVVARGNRALSPQIRKILFLLHNLVLGCHWASLGWVALGLSDHYCSNENACWTLSSTARDGDLWSLYLEALEWNSKLAKPLGGNVAERFYTMMVTAAAAIAIGSVMAVLQAAVLDLDRQRGLVHKRVAEVISLLRNRGATADVMENVENYIRARYSNADMKTVDLFKGLSVTQRRDVAIAMYASHLSRFAFFPQVLGRTFVEKLCQKVSERLFTPNDVIVSQDSVMNDWLCLISGSMYGYTLTTMKGRRSSGNGFDGERVGSIKSEAGSLKPMAGTETPTLQNLFSMKRTKSFDNEQVHAALEVQARYQPFSWIGEMALFSTNDEIPIWTETYQAAEFSVLLSVTRSAFDEILQEHETWFKTVYQHRNALAEGELCVSVFGCRRCGGADHAEERCERRFDWTNREGFWEMVLDSGDSFGGVERADDDFNHTGSADFDMEGLLKPAHKEDACAFVRGLITGNATAEEISEQIASVYPEIGFYHVAVDSQSRLRDRTICSILCMYWALNERYEDFVFGQSDDQKLTRESWRGITKMASSSRFSVDNWEQLDYVIIALMLHLLGKAKHWRRVCAPGISDPAIAALEVVSHNPEKLPSVARLSVVGRAEVMKLLTLDSNFNLAQLLQAECIPDTVLSFASFVQEYGALAQRRYEFKWLCEMGSIAGWSRPYGSMFLTEKMYQSIALALSSMENISQTSAIEAYRQYLRMRAIPQGLPIETDRDHAVVRVACFLRLYDRASAGEVIKAFQRLSPPEHSELVTYLTGSKAPGRPAIMLMFAPALMVNVKGNAFVSLEYGLKVLLAAFRIAAKGFSSSDRIVVVCYELAKLAKLTYSDEHFLKCTQSMHLSPSDRPDQTQLIFERQIWEDLQKQHDREPARRHTMRKGSRSQTGRRTTCTLSSAATDVPSSYVDDLLNKFNSYTGQTEELLEAMQQRQDRQDALIEEILELQSRLLNPESDAPMLV